MKNNLKNQSACNGHGEKYSRKYLDAVTALATAPTFGDAAREVDVSERTLRRWNQRSDFRRLRLDDQAHRQAVALRRVESLAEQATRVLEQKLRGTGLFGDDREQLRAVKLVFDIMLKASQLGILERRLAALEQQEEAPPEDERLPDGEDEPDAAAGESPLHVPDERPQATPAVHTQPRKKLIFLPEPEGETPQGSDAHAADGLAAQGAHPGDDDRPGAPGSAAVVPADDTPPGPRCPQMSARSTPPAARANATGTHASVAPGLTCRPWLRV